MDIYTIEQVEVSPADVVIDTCILMDILFAERPRHARAMDLAALLAASKRNVFIPAHAYFELVSAIASEHRRRVAPLTLVGSRSALLPFTTVVVSIDLNFVNDYLISSLAAGQFANVSGGDMIFVVIALKYKLVLLSEDAPLRVRAQRVGVDAMDADTYISQILSRSGT